ncbi:hypothetical protein ACHAXR_006272 [Thalassiosira sp. AJA248-18]
MPLQRVKMSHLIHPPPIGDDESTSGGAMVAPCACAAAIAAAGQVSPSQWTDILKHVVQYLTADEFKSLRLVGGKDMLNLSDPSLTCHLHLRMDTAPFFSNDARITWANVRKWLTNRRCLVINNVDSKLNTNRVAYMVAKGYLDSVSQLIVFDCHAHHAIIALLSQLPNLESLVLADQGSEEQVLDDLESAVACVGKMSSLKHLDIEFDCTVNGSRLSFLRNLQGLEHLRLRGFDLSDGIPCMRGLRSLNSLHLCHGNFYSSPSNDINEKDLLTLMGLAKLRHVHLEGFDCLSAIGLKPFCTTPVSVERLVLKHCQDLSESCIPSIGRMEHLNSLHIVHSAYDDVPVLSKESLHHLNALTSLRSLSLFYILGDLADLKVLWGLTSLETLNIALEDDIDFEHLCQSILPSFVSLRKLRIFSEDGTNYTCHHGNLEVEYAAFNFGDLVYLE